MSEFAKEHSRADDPGTSHQAAALAEGTASVHKTMILAHLKAAHPMTSEEIASALDLNHSQAWRRVSDLKNEGQVVDSGDRRPNLSGRMATVWALAPPEPTDLLGDPITTPETVRKMTKPNGHVRPPGSGPDGQTCKTCHHITRLGHGRRNYLKCFLAKSIWTRGPGSDIRAKDPACERWETKREDEDD